MAFEKPPLNISNVSIEAVGAYFEKFGWSKVPSKNSKVIIYGGYEDDEGRDITITLPASKRFADSDVLLASAVSSFASLTGRSFEDSLDEIESPSRDVIKIRLVLDSSQGDLPSLEDTTTVLNEVKTILAYSADIERLRQLEPKFEPPQYLAKYGPYGTSYLKKCKFGHTFRGSFGIVIESYLGDQNKGILPIVEPFMPLPIERRVVQRFKNGLQTAHEAEQKKSVDVLLNSYQTGMNGNMCRSLSELFLNTPVASIDCKVLWSPTWAPEDGFYDEVKVTRRSTQYLKSASDLMKEKDDPKTLTIKGEIKRLEQADPEDQQERITSPIGRRVAISTKISGKPRQVIAYLDEFMHKQACDAYKERREIQLTGTLDLTSSGLALLRFPRDLVVGEPIVDDD